MHEDGVHHAHFVDNQQVALQGVLVVLLEAALLEIELQEPMNGLGLDPGSLVHAFCSSACWSSQEDFGSESGNNLQDGVE